MLCFWRKYVIRKFRTELTVSYNSKQSCVASYTRHEQVIFRLVTSSFILETYTWLEYKVAAALNVTDIINPFVNFDAYRISTMKIHSMKAEIASPLNNICSAPMKKVCFKYCSSYFEIFP
jgi:hypothetical protein